MSKRGVFGGSSIVVRSTLRSTMSRNGPSCLMVIGRRGGDTRRNVTPCRMSIMVLDLLIAFELDNGAGESVSSLDVAE